MSYTDWIQSAGIAISLFATIYQLWIHNKSLKMTIVTTISERNDSLLEDIETNWRTIKDFSKPFNQRSKNRFSDPRVALMYRTLNFFDEMLYYYQLGYINKGTWELYQNTICNFFTEKFAITFWDYARQEYNEELQRIVNNAIKKIADSPSPF